MLQNVKTHIGLRYFLTPKKTLLVLLLSLTVYAAASAFAQGSYNSGSTGADGAFNPTASATVQLPESGVFNYTTVNIPTGVTITYKRNSQNTPVTILATGNVVINGTINLDGASPSSSFFGGAGGPGGFDGGRGGGTLAGTHDGLNGSGPGGGGGGRNINALFGGGYGGYATPGTAASGAGGGSGGSVYGSPTIIPLIGGSGGGGAAGHGGSRGSSGGGGGGAILIASSSSISGSGSILARAGNGGCLGSFCGSSGSGGAIRLAANSINGELTLNVSGLTLGGAGYISIEAFDTTGFSPSINPSFAVVSLTAPRPAVPTNAPQLRIVSVAGVNAPTNVSGSFNGADIVLPATQTGPVTVALNANNIPLSTPIQVILIPPNGASTSVQSSALSGTQASSTATASVTLPSGTSLIYATAAIDLAQLSYLQPLFIEGERVYKVEIAATFGGPSEITYITDSGKRVKRANE